VIPAILATRNSADAKLADRVHMRLFPFKNNRVLEPKKRVQRPACAVELKIKHSFIGYTKKVNANLDRRLIG
jgi:hypothetical protein